MRQNPENRRAVSEGLGDHLDEQAEARRVRDAIALLPDTSPTFSNEKTDYYFVDMFESKLIKLPPVKTVILETKYLYTCTAVAIFILNDLNERFCLLSHFPYYIGNELDNEMLRHDIPHTSSTKRNAVVIMPAGYREEGSEEESVKNMLEKHNVWPTEVAAYWRMNVPGDMYKDYDGKVTIRWEPDKDPIVSYLDENAGWARISIEMKSQH